MTTTNPKRFEKALKSKSINAIIVKPNSSLAIRDAFEYYLEDEKRAFKIGSKGREKCIFYFDEVKNKNIEFSSINEYKVYKRIG